MIRRAGIAICGLGTIGAEVARLLAKRSDAIRETYGLDIEIRAVLERSPERASRANLDPGVVETDWAKLTERGDVELIVELLGGVDPACDIMQAALRNGKHVVTANKEALAKHYSELIGAAHSSGRALMFEASVGGGIPIMTSMRQALISNNIQRVRGILNGTTNYILTKMTQEGAAYEDALQDAQRLGYAEPDPTADVEGFDAAYKIAILASMISGTHVHPESVDRSGITGVTPEQIENATANGRVIKLIAEANCDANGVSALVRLIELDSSEPLAGVNVNINALQLEGDLVGPVTLIGQGAGPSPTASVIVSDIVEALRTGDSANAPRLG